jgi:uncharacterized protein DUF6599
MKFSTLIFVLTTLLMPLAFAGEGARITPTILPNEFAGWIMTGSRHASKDPAVADAVNAALLKEYGFTDFEFATYKHDDRKLTVKAARFADTSGAYGAFTYYKMPQMLNEKISDQGASLNERVLFYRGSILVDAVFEKLTAMSAADLRELAGVLPLPSGSTRNLPGLPAYLPKTGYVKNTAKYVVGPIGLEKVQAPLSASLVDFRRGAEAVLGTYQTSGGDATLMLINYPTNQIAAEHLRRIEADHQQNAKQANASDAKSFFAKRTGPIVLIASGSLSQSEGKSLLAAVNYDADVTWNENTYITKKDNLANLLVNIIILCAILIAFAGVAGLAFGGIRVLVKRILPDKIFDRTEEMEFIALHLADNESRSSDSQVSSSIKAV